MALQYCYECGKQISDAAPSCPHCGAPAQNRVVGVNGAPSDGRRASKSRSMAILLCVFFGWLGAHWFYLEQPGRGVKYLLFCWLLIPGLLFSLITAIQLLGMSDQRFQQAYGGTQA